MSRNSKIALIVVGTLAVICVGLCGIGYFLLPRLAENMVSQKPEDAKRIGAEIAEYTLPDGYQEFMGMNFLVYKMVMIAPSRDAQFRDGLAFMLMGMNVPTGNQAEMERQMQQSFQQQYGQSGSAMKYVGTEQVMIRGKQVTLTLTESEGGSTARLRQAIGTFEGKNGLVMVMVMGDANAWDDALMREFLGSIQ